MIIRQSYNVDSTIFEYLNNNSPDKTGNICILFNHGLGDYILFLPIFEKLQKVFKDKWNLKIGSLPEKGFKCLHKDSIFVTPPYGSYSDEFDVIFNINYVEPPREKLNDDKINKPELCNKLEIGIPYFEWGCYKLPMQFTKIFKHNRIGVHFFGYAWGNDKNADVDVSKKIWDEIIKSSFNPYEIQMIPPNKIGLIEHPSFLNRENSLRFNYPNIRLMIQEISKCDYFIGVDSGPLYLALSILGPDRCIGLQKNREIKKAFPRPSINIVDIKDYKDGSILSLIEQGENNV